MRIGIFGGSFNPIHNAHIALARTILHEAGLDEVWLLVSPHNPLKVQSSLLDEQKRYEMVVMALADEPGLIASDYEFHLQRPSYTWNTLQHLREDYPQHHFSLVIGADNWALFPRWAHSEDILNEYDIIVYPRKGTQMKADALPHNVRLVDTPEIDITSTDIRRMVAQGENYETYVPGVVVEKIRQLYSK